MKRAQARLSSYTVPPRHPPATRHTSLPSHHLIHHSSFTPYQHTLVIRSETHPHAPHHAHPHAPPPPPLHHGPPSHTHTTSTRTQHLFFGLARLYAKHGLNKDSLVTKLPSLCNDPPDRRTFELLKTMAECTPVAVEQMLQHYVEQSGPGHFTQIPHITEVMCKIPSDPHGSAASKALKLLKQCAAQVTPDRPEDLPY